MTTSESTARALAGEHRAAATVRTRGRANLPRRLKAIERTITSAIRCVTEAPPHVRFPFTGAEWLLDNEYLVRESIEQVRENLPRRFLRELPRVDDGRRSRSPRPGPGPDGPRPGAGSPRPRLPPPLRRGVPDGPAPHDGGAVGVAHDRPAGHARGSRGARRVPRDRVRRFDGEPGRACRPEPRAQAGGVRSHPAHDREPRLGRLLRVPLPRAPSARCGSGGVLRAHGLRDPRSVPARRRAARPAQREERARGRGGGRPAGAGCRDGAAASRRLVARGGGTGRARASPASCCRARPRAGPRGGGRTARRHGSPCWWGARSS